MLIFEPKGESMNFIKRLIVASLSLTLASCEANVIDASGASIKKQMPSIETQTSETQDQNEIIIVKNLNVKGVIPYIDMETGRITYDKKELQGHDLSIEVDFSVFQVYVKLGEDYQTGQQVEALNTKIKDFDLVEIAPTSGYQADGANGELVIGNSFYDGGNGWTGFHMTKDVFVFKTRTGKFAKLQILQAKQGNVDLHFYIQKDNSNDIRTIKE